MLAHASLGRLLRLALVVVAAPRSSPGEADWLDALLVEGTCLVADKVVDLSVLRDKLAPPAWVDLVLRKRARISFHDHFFLLIIILNPVIA